MCQGRSGPGDGYMVKRVVDPCAPDSEAPEGPLYGEDGVIGADDEVRWRYRAVAATADQRGARA